jgi:hypothetical protein
LQIALKETTEMAIKFLCYNIFIILPYRFCAALIGFNDTVNRASNIFLKSSAISMVFLLSDYFFFDFWGEFCLDFEWLPQQHLYLFRQPNGKPDNSCHRSGD